MCDFVLETAGHGWIRTLHSQVVMVGHANGVPGALGNALYFNALNYCVPKVRTAAGQTI